MDGRENLLGEVPSLRNPLFSMSRGRGGGGGRREDVNDVEREGLE
jgi:hypothetical protein